MTRKFSYRKKEKLKSRKLLEEIFSKGKTIVIPPLKIFYYEPSVSLDFRVKAAVGVSSKHFKKAVDRNRIKRLLREAYRTEKVSLHEYLNEQNRQLIIFILYIERTVPVYEALKTKTHSVIERLIKQLHESSVANT